MSRDFAHSVPAAQTSRYLVLTRWGRRGDQCTEKKKNMKEKLELATLRKHYLKTHCLEEVSQALLSPETAQPRPPSLAPLPTSCSIPSHTLHFRESKALPTPVILALAPQHAGGGNALRSPKLTGQECTTNFFKSIIFTILHFTALNCMSLAWMLHQYYTFKPRALCPQCKSFASEFWETATSVHSGIEDGKSSKAACPTAQGVLNLVLWGQTCA